MESSLLLLSPHLIKLEYRKRIKFGSQQQSLLSCLRQYLLTIKNKLLEIRAAYSAILTMTMDLIPQDEGSVPWVDLVFSYYSLVDFLADFLAFD